MPSAIVGVPCTGMARPAASDAGYGATAAACAPTICTAGSRLLTATAIPAARPPPPTGTTTVRTWGHCSMISNPRVPWPVTMSGCSKGWISTLPVRPACSAAAARASSTEAPCSMMSAP